jgi:hypothetical protein
MAKAEETMTRTRLLLLACFIVTPTLASAREDDLDMTGKRELQMLHCPSAAPGATTVVHARPRGVALVVSAPTEFGRREIRRRAATQQEIASRPGRGRDEHTGSGTGSARFGYCPGIMADTKVTVSDIPDGARIVVTARSAKAAAELRQATRTRAARLKAQLRASTR